MPMIPYKAADDTQIEEFFWPTQPIPDTLTRDGKRFRRDRTIQGDAGVGRRTTGDGCYPKLSDALGVHPSQRGMAVEQARRAGVPTEFTHDGRAHITSAAHQRKLEKALGFFNKSDYTR